MKTNWMGLGLALLLFGIPASARAQVSIGAGVGIDIRFPAPPPLVVVSPGVQIVPEYDEEVFFVNNYYWVHRDAVWYRTRRCDDRASWRPVRTVYVPPTLVRMPPGRYRHYYRDDDGYWRAHDPDAYRGWRERHPSDERRAWWDSHRRDRQVRMEQERSWREHRRQEQVEQRRHQQDRREHDRDRHDDRRPGGGQGRH
jgi:hypothetical protein